MLGLSNFASRKIDEMMIEDIGLPGVVLMEEAALRIYDILADNYELRKSRVLILAGKGNNGGDGLALARFLANRKIEVKVFLLADIGLSKEASLNLEVLKNMQVETKVYHEGMDLEDPDLIVDALLGTGFTGNIEGTLKDLVEKVNRLSAIKVAIDIPTGLNGDNGSGDIYVENSHTIALGYLKPGHLLTNKIFKLDLVKLEFYPELEKEIKEQDSFNYFLIDELQDIWGERKKETHKGSYGKIGVLGGSRTMEGAAFLAGLAALKTGSGLVTLWLESLENLPTRSLELMLEEWEDFLNKELDILIIGPGLGRDFNLDINKVLREFKGTVLIDADGLLLLAEGKIDRQAITGDLILTPHPKEMEMLIGKFNNREEAVFSLAEKYRATAIIKGFRTLVSDDRAFWINLTGNPGMATAGSGDVLSGIIGSLKGQGLDTTLSAAVGVYLHGLSGDIAAEEIGEDSVMAGDIVKYLPAAIKIIKSVKNGSKDIIEIY